MLLNWILNLLDWEENIMTMLRQWTLLRSSTIQWLNKCVVFWIDRVLMTPLCPLCSKLIRFSALWNYKMKKIEKMYFYKAWQVMIANQMLLKLLKRKFLSMLQLLKAKIMFSKPKLILISSLKTWFLLMEVGVLSMLIHQVNNILSQNLDLLLL